MKLIFLVMFVCLSVYLCLSVHDVFGHAGSVSSFSSLDFSLVAFESDLSPHGLRQRDLTQNIPFP